MGLARYIVGVLGDNPGIVVSVCALTFALFSFWWMNWRPGKLRVSPPRSYAFALQEDKLVLHVPLVLFNGGALPVLVQNLQLIFVNDKVAKPLVFVATTEQIGATKQRAWATQFPVHGRQAVALVCDFQRKPGGALEAGNHVMELQAQLGTRENAPWKKVCRFTLNVSAQAIAQRNALLAYDNMLGAESLRPDD